MPVTEIFFQLTARLHPLVVHLPIGILLLAFFLELLSLRQEFRKVRVAVRPTLLFGFIFSIVAVLTGLSIASEGGYNASLLSSHKIFGIATTVVAGVIYFLWPILKRVHKRQRRRIRLALLGVLCVVLATTGHFGGSLTHGEDFLFAAFKTQQQESLETKLATIQNIDSAVLFRDVIQPILEVKCYSCHSAEKQKADLRLDSPEFIEKGGEDGLVINRQTPDSSALYKSLVLPIERDEHMPPREKPQLTSSEIDLIHTWIQEGSHFDRQVSQYSTRNEIKIFFEALKNSISPKEFWVPQEKIVAANETVVMELKRHGLTILPVAADNNHLMVTIPPNVTMDTSTWKQLTTLAPQVVWLKSSRRLITKSALNAIGRLNEMRILYLEQDTIETKSLEPLKSLTELRYLNLTATPLDEEALAVLKSLSHLKEVYLFQTGISSRAIFEWSRSRPEVLIDTGRYQLPMLASDTTTYRKK